MGNLSASLERWAVRGPAALLVVCSIIVSATYLTQLPRANPYRPDFTVFWAAGDLTRRDVQKVYRVEDMTAAQYEFTGGYKGPRPFAYPPSALLVFAPLSLLSFWPALLTLWIASLAVFVPICRRLAGWTGAALATTSFPVVFALASGQLTLILGSATIWAILSLEKRPLLAGGLLGVVAAIKPQAVMLAPIGLLAGGHRRALAAAIGAGCAMGGCAILAFGFNPWIDWLSSLREFPHLVDRLGLLPRGVTPTSIAHELGLSGWADIGLKAAGVAAGVALVIWAFRRQDTLLRIGAIILGGLLSSPYAVSYELAAYMPVAVAGLLSGRLSGVASALPMTGLLGVWAAPVAVAALLRSRIARPAVVVHARSRAE
jgi:Glycosyltransferase family 87